MLDIKRLEKNEIIPEKGVGYYEAYSHDLKSRGGNPEQLEKLLVINTERKKVLTETESKKAEQNRVGQEIAKLKRSGGDASAYLEEMQSLSTLLKTLDEKRPISLYQPEHEEQVETQDHLEEKVQQNNYSQECQLPSLLSEVQIPEIVYPLRSGCFCDSQSSGRISPCSDHQCLQLSQDQEKE